MHHLIKGAEIEVTKINSTCIFEIYVNFMKYLFSITRYLN